MRHLFLTGAISLLFIYGCAQPQNSAPQPVAKKCATPIAEIYPQSITPKQNDLGISPELIKSLLEKNTQDNCFALIEKPTKDSYEADISYKTLLQSSSNEKIASSEVKNTITSEVSISLKNATSTRTFQGKSSIQINGKKILSIGQDASITQEDKEQSIAKALKAAYDAAVQNFGANTK